MAAMCTGFDQAMRVLVSPMSRARASALRWPSLVSHVSARAKMSRAGASEGAA